MRPCEVIFSGRMPLMSAPLKRMLPRACGSRPVMALNRVVLPAPFGPMRPVVFPRATEKLALSSACRPPKVARMSLISARPRNLWADLTINRPHREAAGDRRCSLGRRISAKESIQLPTGGSYQVLVLFVVIDERSAVVTDELKQGVP